MPAGTCRPLWVAVAITLALPASAEEASLRCDRGIVSLGDHKIDLLGKCGAPALVETRREERLVAAQGGEGGAVSAWSVEVTVETWTFNFGPSRFVQRVTLDTGKVVAVESGGYGYALAPPSQEGGLVRRARCDPAGFQVGDRAFDVLSRCGEPATRDVREEIAALRVIDPRTGQVASRTVAVEAWAFDFGPRSLVRIVELRDGLVRQVATGGYGYSPGEPLPVP